jgi:hypothetical protein
MINIPRQGDSVKEDSYQHFTATAEMGEGLSFKANFIGNTSFGKRKTQPIA